MSNLFKKFTQEKKQNKVESLVNMQSHDELFLCIILTNQDLQAALVNKKLGIQEFSNIKTYFNDRDLISQLDQALQDLGTMAEEIADCVFIFDQSWLKDGELIDTKKVIVQKLSESLSLLAVGQLSIIEAIHQSRAINDSRDSSLTIYLREESFDLALVKHGKLLINLKIGRSSELSDDLQEGLARVSQELGEEGKYFPNKVFLTSLALNQKNLNRLQEKLQSFDWTKVSGFLQAPEFVVLETDFLIKSSSLAISQMLLSDPQERSENEEIKNEIVLEDRPLDVQERKVSTFGIDIEVDSSREQIKGQFSDSKNEKTEEIEMGSVEPAESLDIKLKKVKNMTPKARFIQRNRKFLLMGIGAGILSLVILFSVFTFFLSKVFIKVHSDTKILQKKIDIILDPKLTESNFEKNLLKVSLVQKSVAGEDLLNTTGVSLVGEKAKGEVNIFNKTSSEKTFPAKTRLKYEGILFELDEEVTVPAAEEKDGGSGVNYGSQQATITANDIGAESNIDEKSKLQIADFSEDTYSATTITKLKGGSSREIRVVSQTDLSNLASQLKENLIKIAEDEFSEESQGGVYYISTGNTKTVDFKYDHKEKDEVETLSLEMSLEVEAIKYLSSDLKQLAQAALSLDLPENYAFVDEEPSMLSDRPIPSDDDDNRLILNTELSAKAKAKIDQESILALVLGKSIEEAKSILEKEVTIVGAEIIYQPAFLSKITNHLPKDVNRFNIVVN